ncbi:cytochrome P450 [Marasmius fiardii PR-910]|nr:cytochrome P450 [Marasmius fiardii PR-910]
MNSSLRLDGVTQGLAISIAFGVILVLYTSRRSHKSLPPGPRALPLIGNLLDIPSRHEWVTYNEWGKRYNSDIIHFEFAGTSTIVLNSAEAINDLLEKRSNIYSSRPRFTMVNEVIGWDWAVFAMPYGKAWNARRKLIHQEFNPKQSERYEPQTIKSVQNLLVGLLREPDDFYRLLRHMAGSTILSITYGISAEVDDPAIDTADRALLGLIAAATPGSFLVDYLPILKYVPLWFPGASFKVKAKEWGKDVDKMLNEPFDTIKREIADGTNKPCFVSYCFDRKEEDGVDETMVRDSAGAMYTAGTDTTVCALRVFILTMVCYPKTQQKAQEEIDRVVGKDRLPSLEDKSMLPYVMAILFEVMRWQPVNPLALAHLVTEEDEYKGFRIPKDSVVLGNIWSVLRDPKLYGTDTDTFRPERFLTEDGKLDPNVPEPVMFYGAGRRICPGRHFANTNMFAAIASILHSFNITKAKDEHENEVQPTLEFEGALQNRPVPFRCEIKPRSKHHERLVLRSANGNMDSIDG